MLYTEHLEERTIAKRYATQKPIRAFIIGDYFRTYATMNLTWFLNGVETPVKTIASLPGNILYSYMKNQAITVQYTPAYYAEHGIEPCSL